jgi:hypothetical protein
MLKSLSFNNVLKSILNIFSEESEIRLQEGDGIRNNFSVVHSSLSSLGVVNVLVIAESEFLIVLGRLLSNSFQLFVSFVGGSSDSLGEGGDFLFQVGDFRVECVKLFSDFSLGSFVLFNPVLVVSSFDFSGLGDLVQELLAEVNNLLDGVRVGLDWCGGGDGGEDVEEGRPGLSGEFLFFGGGGEVVGEFSEGGFAHLGVLL